MKARFKKDKSEKKNNRGSYIQRYSKKVERQKKTKQKEKVKQEEKKRPEKEKQKDKIKVEIPYCRYI